MKYNAFISYSHAADAPLARALQASLHLFAKPWNRLRALRVFRDSSSLAATAELWPSIVAALGESEFFLLMASPQSAGSKWVQKEIDWWCEHRSLDRLLIVLTGGELAWDDASGALDPAGCSAISQQLRARFKAEPLWVDLRWAKNPERLTLRDSQFRQAVLDLAAPLHGKPKDDLDGDDVRQFRRTTHLRRFVIAALLVLTTASMAAAVYALKQRNEAIRQSQVALARQLAAQSDLLRERNEIDLSVNLASEAVSALASAGGSSLEVDLSLRRALSGLATRVTAFEGLDGAKLRFSADGRLLWAERFSPTDRAIGFDVSTGRKRYEIGGGAVVAEGEAPGRYQAKPHSVGAAATLDGRFLVTRTIGDPHPVTLEVWATAPVRKLGTFTHDAAGNISVKISPNGRFVAVSDQMREVFLGKVRVWSVERQRDVLRLDRAEFLDFSPDAVHGATSSGLWRLTDVDTAPVRVFDWKAEYVVFNQTGQHIATRETYQGDIQVWDVSRRARVRTSRAAPEGGLMAIDAEGKQAIITTQLWDLEHDVLRARGSMFPDAATFLDGVPLLARNARDPQNGQTIETFKMWPAGAALTGLRLKTAAIPWLRVRGDKVIDLLVDSGAALRFDTWNWMTQVMTSSPPIPLAKPLAWTISDDDTHYAAAAADGSVLVGDIGDAGRPVSIPVGQAPEHMLLNSDGSRLVIASGATVELWKVSDKKRIHQFAVPGEIDVVGVSHDGDIVSVITHDDSPSRVGSSYAVTQWSASGSGQPSTRNLGRKPRAPCVTGAVDTNAASSRVQISQTGDCAKNRSGGIDHNVVVSRNVRLEHPHAVRVLATSPNSSHIVTIDASGFLYVWTLDSSELVSQACARAPQPITAAQWEAYIGPRGPADACGRIPK